MYKKRSTKYDKKGFTLIELLIVIAIIAILLTILAPALHKAKLQAQRSWCLSNIRAIMTSTIIYTEESKNYLPFSAPERAGDLMGFIDYGEILMTKVGLDPKRMHCPGDKWQPGSIAAFWKRVYGRSMNEGDHCNQEVPPGASPEVNYSYFWNWKMTMYMDAPGAPSWSQPKKWKLSSVKYPELLIPYSCFWNQAQPGNQTSWDVNETLAPHLELSHLSGFLAGHAQAIPLEKITLRSFEAENPWDTVPDRNLCSAINLDWTIDGIEGRDIF